MDQSLNTNVEALLKEKYDFFQKYHVLSQDNPWDLVEDKDGFLIHNRGVPNSVFKMNRTQTIIPFPLEEVVAVVTDPSQRNKFDGVIESSQEVQRIEQNTALVYTKLKTPNIPFVSPRDISVVGRIYKNEDNSVLSLATSINCAPIPLNKKFERAQLHIQAWLMKPLENGQTHCIVLTYLDLKGNIPAFVVNGGAKRQAQQVKNLVEYLGSTEKFWVLNIQIHHLPYTTLSII